MNVSTIVVGNFQVNCLVVWGKSRQAIVIDPGADASNIISYLKKNELSVASYMLTHGHIDHISALAAMYRILPAPIGIHKNDLEWAFDMANQMPPFYSAPDRPAEIERILKDGQELCDGGLSYKVIATPGHTPGSVCFYFEEHNTLITGDTLFAGSVGRTDLPGGDSELLGKSLKILSLMPSDTKVYTGHGPQTDIGYEKKNNFFMLRQELLYE